MAPKRKAAVSETNKTPEKRRTRSSGLLDATQVDGLTSTRSATNRFSDSTPITRPPVTRTYAKRRHTKLPYASCNSPESLKENSTGQPQHHIARSDGDDSEDQLILSPSKTRSWQRLPTRTKKNRISRVYMHSVEIVSPPKRDTQSQQNDTGSPVPTRQLQEQEQSDDPLSSPFPTNERKLARMAASASPSKKRNVNPHPAPASVVLSHKTPVRIPHGSPSKRLGTTHLSPSSLPRVLPAHLHHCLKAQKRAILCALRNPPDFIHTDHEDSETEDDGPLTNDVAFQQLTDLLNGTVVRGEGNSCLLLGPRGSGKTLVGGLFHNARS
jgi:origin recognition complex subunit 4